MILKFDEFAKQIGMNPQDLYDEMTGTDPEPSGTDCLKPGEIDAIELISEKQVAHLKECQACRCSLATAFFFMDALAND